MPTTQKVVKRWLGDAKTQRKQNTLQFPTDQGVKENQSLDHVQLH